MKSKLTVAIAISVGFIAGAACTVAYAHYAGRRTTSYVTTADLDGNWGLHIPSGTEMVDGRSTDGEFYTAQLRLNFDSLTYNTKIKPYVGQKRSSVLEIWVD